MLVKQGLNLTIIKTSHELSAIVLRPKMIISPKALFAEPLQAAVTILWSSKYYKSTLFCIEKFTGKKGNFYDLGAFSV